LMWATPHQHVEVACANVSVHTCVRLIAISQSCICAAGCSAAICSTLLLYKSHRFSDCSLVIFVLRHALRVCMFSTQESQFFFFALRIMLPAHLRTNVSSATWQLESELTICKDELGRVTVWCSWFVYVTHTHIFTYLHSLM
jgi:hypothetical protein